LNEAKKRAKENILVKEKERNESERLSGDELEHAASVIGYGAVKYYDLKSNRLTNYAFSYDRMLDMKGNTAVYLMYAYARIKSIIRKSGLELNELSEKVAAATATANASNPNQEALMIVLGHESEWQIALRLIRFKEVVELVIGSLEPHHLCDYLYDLSNTFSAFHRDCRVIEADGTVNTSRLLLCHATANVMSKCFELLGLETLERL